MNKVILAEDTSLSKLQRYINELAKSHEIVNVSISSCHVGLSTYYTAAVTYKV